MFFPLDDQFLKFKKYIPKNKNSKEIKWKYSEVTWETFFSNTSSFMFDKHSIYKLLKQLSTHFQNVIPMAIA